MPRTDAGRVAVVIEGFDLPGRDNVHLALRGTSKDRAALVTPGHPWQATEQVRGDAASARWQVEVTVRRLATPEQLPNRVGCSPASTAPR